MHRFIFVTGGVVSGLGKGITAASIGLLLKNSGLSVDVIKMDPYLNVDPGTMSPFEHGEVFVLSDGSETDLDLGHYERFLDTDLTGASSVTSGKIYSSILDKERRGDYLGRNVQLIPHVTDEIMGRYMVDLPADDVDHVRLIEIGGSTGDMEGDVFLESIRQFEQKYPDQVMHVHLGYVPYLDNSGEYKSKPFQNSIRGLLTRGLKPDVLVARYHMHGDGPDESVFEKIALFSNQSVDHVVSLPDLNSIYKVPAEILKSGMPIVLEEFTGVKINTELPEFYNQIEDFNPDKTVDIGIVAKYSRLEDAYMSVIESIRIAGAKCNIRANYHLIDAEELERGENTEEFDKLKKMDGIVAAGGFGSRGMDGKIAAIKYVRENKIPYLGICLGLQMAVVEYARNVAGIVGAVSAEQVEGDQSSVNTDDLFIEFMSGQKDIHRKGGTMRLGNYDCDLAQDSLASEMFGGGKTVERHRHRLEVNPANISKVEDNGMKVSGVHNYTDNNGQEVSLVEIIELPQETHPYFIAIQSHPELLSRPGKPHPLFKGLIEAAAKKSD